jgi:OTU domain-containing protein 6
MAGNKKNKSKKTASRLPTPPPIANDDEVDLMNDLLDQLDARDQSVQIESAKVLNEMNLKEQAEQLEVTSKKSSAKDRFKARQVRKVEERCTFDVH